MLDVCETAKHYDGTILAAFGLGLGAWLARDRERAAELYAVGIAAGRAAAAARAPLSAYAQNKYEGCMENLAVLRGEVKLEPSALNAKRAFIVSNEEGKLPAVAPSRCGACGKDFATMTCGRCRSSRYCDAACQRAAWPAHKPNCKESK